MMKEKEQLFTIDISDGSANHSRDGRHLSGGLCHFGPIGLAGPADHRRSNARSKRRTARAKMFGSTSGSVTTRRFVTRRVSVSKSRRS